MKKWIEGISYIVGAVLLYAVVLTATPGQKISDSNTLTLDNRLVLSTPQPPVEIISRRPSGQVVFMHQKDIRLDGLRLKAHEEFTFDDVIVALSMAAEHLPKDEPDLQAVLTIYNPPLSTGDRLRLEAERADKAEEAGRKVRKLLAQALAWDTAQRSVK